MANKKFTHGIVAYEKVEGALYILHFCGYGKKPTAIDIQSLKDELNTDPEFCLVGRINNGVFLMEATEDMLEYYRNL